MTDDARPSVDDTVPPLERTIDLPDMVAYAGATWDWHRTHYDAEFVAAKQLPGSIVDGQVFGALLTEMLQDWLGPNSFVRELSFTFRNLMYAGETVCCEGVVSEATDDHLAVDMTVTILGAGGAPDRYAVRPASAVVLLGVADGPAG